MIDGLGSLAVITDRPGRFPCCMCRVICTYEHHYRTSSDTSTYRVFHGGSWSALWRARGSGDLGRDSLSRREERESVTISCRMAEISSRSDTASCAIFVFNRATKSLPADNDISATCPRGVEVSAIASASSATLSRSVSPLCCPELPA